MKLELKHLAPYLPYELPLKITVIDHFWLDDSVNRLDVGNTITLSPKWLHLWEDSKAYVSGTKFDFKPILRPLSDLTKEIEHNGEKFIPINELLGEKRISTPEMLIKSIKKGYLTWRKVQLLLEWHFDVFGLIEAGLAIEKRD